jgi:hypothetical protein
MPETQRALEPLLHLDPRLNVRHTILDTVDDNVELVAGRIEAAAAVRSGSVALPPTT